VHRQNRMVSRFVKAGWHRQGMKQWLSVVSIVGLISWVDPCPLQTVTGNKSRV